MKKILVVASAAVLLMLGGCRDAGVYNSSYGNIIKGTKGLEGCTVHRVESGSGSGIYVVRCPNSNTTTTWQEGKTTVSTAVIEEDMNMELEKLMAKRKALDKLSDEDKRALGIN